LRCQVATASASAKGWARWVTARSALVISRRLVHPDAYAAVGLDPAEAHRAALASPSRRETLRWASSRLVRFFSELELMGAPGMLLWRRSGLFA
jgi:hypothetical protein